MIEVNEPLSIAVIGAIGPTIAGLAAWRAAVHARRNTATGNGQVLGRYVVDIDEKVDRLHETLANRADRIEAKQTAHDARDRAAFRAAGLPYPEPDEA